MQSAYEPSCAQKLAIQGVTPIADPPEVSLQPIARTWSVSNSIILSPGFLNIFLFFELFFCFDFIGFSFEGIQPGACPRIDKGASPLVPSCTGNAIFQPPLHRVLAFYAILGQHPVPHLFFQSAAVPWYRDIGNKYLPRRFPI